MPSHRRAIEKSQSVMEHGGRGGEATLQVERLHTSAALDGLSDIWSRLLAQCPKKSLFLSHAWAVCWWRYFGSGRQLWVLVVRRGGVPVGIAPLMIEKGRYSGLPARIMGFFSNNHVSQSDFIIPCCRSDVLAAIAQALKEDAKHWDVLRLKNMPQGSDQLELCEVLRGAGLRPFGPDEPSHLCRVYVRGTLDDYLGHRSRNFRSSLRRARHQLDQLGSARYTLSRSRADLQTAVPAFFALGEKSLKRDSAHAIYTENERAFHEALAAVEAEGHGYELRFLECDGKIVAGLLSYVFARTIYLLVTYFDSNYAKYDPGRNLIWQQINATWNSGDIDVIDLNGDSSFLKGWADECQTFEKVTACNRRVYSTFLALLKRSKRSFFLARSSLAEARSVNDRPG